MGARFGTGGCFDVSEPTAREGGIRHAKKGMDARLQDVVEHVHTQPEVSLLLILWSLFVPLGSPCRLRRHVSLYVEAKRRGASTTSLGLPLLSFPSFRLVWAAYGSSGHDFSFGRWQRHHVGGFRPVARGFPPHQFRCTRVSLFFPSFPPAFDLRVQHVDLRFLRPVSLVVLRRCIVPFFQCGVVRARASLVARVHHSDRCKKDACACACEAQGVRTRARRGSKAGRGRRAFGGDPLRGMDGGRGAKGTDGKTWLSLGSGWVLSFLSKGDFFSDPRDGWGFHSPMGWLPALARDMGHPLSWSLPTAVPLLVLERKRRTVELRRTCWTDRTNGSLTVQHVNEWWARSWRTQRTTSSLPTSPSQPVSCQPVSPSPPINLSFPLTLSLDLSPSLSPSPSPNHSPVHRTRARVFPPLLFLRTTAVPGERHWRRRKGKNVSIHTCAGNLGFVTKPCTSSWTPVGEEGRSSDTERKGNVNDLGDVYPGNETPSEKEKNATSSSCFEPRGKRRSLSREGRRERGGIETSSLRSTTRNTTCGSKHNHASPGREGHERCTCVRQQGLEKEQRPSSGTDATIE